MSGLTNCYRFSLTGFMDSVNIFTSREDSKRNFIQFCPFLRCSVEQGESIVQLFFQNLGAETHYHLWPNQIERSKYGKLTVREIVITGQNVRVAVDRLFHGHIMDATLRSKMENPIRELEKCLELQTKINENITPAQRAIIESFVEPYTGILKANMEPWQIERSIEKACMCIKAFPDSEKSITPFLRAEFYQRNPYEPASPSNPTFPIINKEWSESTQKEVIESLYMIAKVLSGMANLEDALVQSGSSLPSLEVQKRIVMNLFA